MNSDELKAHRRAICEALIDGKQCQVLVGSEWVNQDASSVAANLFYGNYLSNEIRIKPEPRKCWVSFNADGTVSVVRHDPGCVGRGIMKWQLVTEEVK